jgi:hypothetical protein
LFEDVPDEVVADAWLLLQQHRWQHNFNPADEKVVHELVEQVLRACARALLARGLPVLLPFHEADVGNQRPDWTCTLPDEVMPHALNTCMFIEVKCPQDTTKGPIQPGQMHRSLWHATKQSIRYQLLARAQTKRA